MFNNTIPTVQKLGNVHNWRSVRHGDMSLRTPTRERTPIFCASLGEARRVERRGIRVWRIFRIGACLVDEVLGTVLLGTAGGTETRAFACGIVECIVYRDHCSAKEGIVQKRERLAMRARQRDLITRQVNTILTLRNLIHPRRTMHILILRAHRLPMCIRHKVTIHVPTCTYPNLPR